MIDLELSFFLWQEIRMLRLDLARQPEHLREAVMAYEEKLTFSLIEKGTMEDLLELRRENSRIMRFLRGNRVEVTPVSVSFISDMCYMCDNPWKFKVFAEGISDPIYLCEEHLEKARKNWKIQILHVEERETT